MAHAPQLDFNAFIDRRRTEQAASGTTPTGHDYAYISDKQTRAAFERMKAVELAVKSTVRVFKQVGKGQLLGNAVKVGDRQFPRLQRLVDQCSETLQITRPAIYIVNSPTLNAATYGTEDDAFIMIHSALVDHYSDEELLTVIGHECGHIHNQHVVYLTALYYLTHAAGALLKMVGWMLEPALIALRGWSRRAGITCDRAGMLCSKDEAVAARALTKLALGSKRLYEEFNLDAFLEQYEEGKGDVSRYMEVFATHPWLPKRVLAMRAFADSALYRKAAGLGEGGISMKEVDDKVLALLKGDA